MPQTFFKYNRTKCRYEPIPIGIKHLLGRALIFLAVSVSLFVGLLFLHSALFTTEMEQALKKENSALDYHLEELSGDMIAIQASLSSLSETERSVYRKLHTSKSPEDVLQAMEVANPKTNSANLKKTFKSAESKTTSLLEKARYTNYYFGNSISVSSKELVLVGQLPSIQPIENIELTRLASGFGMQKNPFHKGNYFHSGVDFVAPRETPVRASANGKVTKVIKSDLPMGDGNVVEIYHGNGYTTRYAHLGKINVSPGQSLKRGAVIAFIGMSGGSVAPHLHYEVIKQNKQVDPIQYFMDGVTSSDYTALVMLAKQKNQSFD